MQKKGIADCRHVTTSLAAVMMALLMVLGGARRLVAQGPSMTTIADTIYRADGTPASGTVLISWPSFQTGNGEAVAAGNQSVAIGSGGAFTMQLVPNIGASPSGVVYVAVYQLDDGTVRKEYWAVPTTSPATISEIRTTPGTGLGNAAVTQQYVNEAVANRALDSTVVHLSGTETITGTKQFAVPPSLPQPVASMDAATKGYVDTAVGNVGSGSYVLKAGDTMTGPLTLPGAPSAPNQAADRQYVDSGLSAKADLVSGLVPATELGSGVASASTCLTGNSTWGTCGGAAPAGVTYATTALNWSQTLSTSLTGGVQNTLTLTPCPVGIDTTSGAGYQVLLNGGGNTETVNLITTAGGCTPGAASGLITFTPFFSYPAGATIGSASGGLQETLNAACGVNPTPWKNSQCNITIPANGANSSINTYNIAGTLYFHSNQSLLNGYGTTLSCTGRGPCLQIGDLTSSNDYANDTVQGLSFRSPLNLTGNPSFNGVQVVGTSATGYTTSIGGGQLSYCNAHPTQCTRTITTATPHGFRPGDMVTVMFTDDGTYWGDAIVYDCGSGATAAACTSSSTTFRYEHSTSTVAPQTTPGVVALAYTAILDNGNKTNLTDITYDKVGEVGAFNNFFDFWDDENAVVTRFGAVTNLNGNANWTGSFLFSAGNQGPLNQIAPVITLRDSTITAINPTVTVYNSNGVYIENTVMQSNGPWQVYVSDTTGNYQGAYLKNIYSESSTGANPLSPPRSPYAGTGIAGLIAGYSSGAATYFVLGAGGVEGAAPSYGTCPGTYTFSYYVVINDVSAGTHSSPMMAEYYCSTGSDTPLIRFPRVANGGDTMSYDILRQITPVGLGDSYPSFGNCNGGSQTACGSVVTGLSLTSACGNNLTCTFTDNASANTQPYSFPSTTGSYQANILFWPGTIVSLNKTVQSDHDNGGSVGIGLSGNALMTMANCSANGQASPGGPTICMTSPASTPNEAAMLLTDGAPAGGPIPLTKGRLNFSLSPGEAITPHHIITLIDSNSAATRATIGYRPSASASDTWIGTDVNAGGVNSASGQLAFGAPISITNYIAATGDGVHANWLERLSANVKEFNVPVKFDQAVTLLGAANGCLNVAAGVIGSTGSPCGSGGSGGGVTSIFGRSGVVTAQSGDYSVSQVVGAAADAAVVHNTGNEAIAGVKTFTNSVVASGGLGLPQGNGYVPAAGGIGIDTQSGMPVVNIGGTTQQIATTSSNISGQAGTALALAAPPTQCSGAFATGIQANGNAVCTTPDVIQLAETAAPADPPNWGVFWFDSVTHMPHVMDNGQTMQLGLSNLFNSDLGGDPADNLEEYNAGTSGLQATAQNLRIYSSYNRGVGTWTRMSMGYDAASGYQVLRSEDSASNALSLGIYIGSGVKWAFSPLGTLKPQTGSAYDMGTDTGQGVRSMFATTSFNMYTQGRQDFEATDGGTAANMLAVYTSSGGGVQTASLASTDGVLGIVSGYSTSTPAKAIVTWAGFAACNFDAAAPVAGDYVIASATQAGKCHDTGSISRPVGAQVIGRVENGGVRVSLDGPSGGSSGVASFNSRTGAVTAQNGDYSVSQVTGAAADVAVVHLAGTETISGPKTFSTDVTLSGNLNVAGNINQTGSSPTQWSGKRWTGTSVTVPSGMDFSMGIGSDNSMHCQLSAALGGGSCAPAGGVTLFNGRGGVVSPVAGDYTAAMVTGAVPNTTTVNGHALSGNVTVSASDLSVGTLPSGVTLPSPIITGTPTMPGYSAPWMPITHGVTLAATTFATSSYRASLYGVSLTYPLTTSKISYNVPTPDSSSNLYDAGIYSGMSGGTCTLVAHIGTTAGVAGSTVMTTGDHTVSWSGGSVTLQPGRYYIAWTSSATSGTAVLTGDTAGWTFAGAVGNASTVTAGVLPATLTCPTDNYTATGIPAVGIN